MDTAVNFLSWLTGMTPPAAARPLRASEQQDEIRRRVPFQPRLPLKGAAREEEERASRKREWLRWREKHHFQGDPREANAIFGGQAAIDNNLMSDDPGMIGAVLAAYQDE